MVWGKGYFNAKGVSIPVVTAPGQWRPGTMTAARGQQGAVAEYEHELITCVDMPEYDFTVPIESPGDSRITTS